jgi:hypothetical protein
MEKLVALIVLVLVAATNVGVAQELSSRDRKLIANLKTSAPEEFTVTIEEMYSVLKNVNWSVTKTKNGSEFVVITAEFPEDYASWIINLIRSGSFGKPKKADLDMLYFIDYKTIQIRYAVSKGTEDEFYFDSASCKPRCISSLADSSETRGAEEIVLIYQYGIE